MLRLTALVRQAMLAALLLSPTAGSAEVQAIFDEPTGAVHVIGLEARSRSQLVEDHSGIFFQNDSLQNVTSMAFTVTEYQDTLVIAPRFKLQAGRDYALRIALSGHEIFKTSVSLQAVRSEPPVLVWHAPQSALIPENTLRFYLMFSEPMAKGQLGDVIRLEHVDGTQIDSPFLNLSAELWDHHQKRLTLLFDPGRLKQGVGPNESAGAPIRKGESYSLVISGAMQSAAGVPVGKEIRLPLKVGAAERRALAPRDWRVTAAATGSIDPLKVLFDRPMDRGASARLITVVDASGAAVVGRVETDGISWQFTPAMPWRSSARLKIAPGLEDVAGNTISAPFDAPPGTIGKQVAPLELALY